MNGRSHHEPFQNNTPREGFGPPGADRNLSNVTTQCTLANCSFAGFPVCTGKSKRALPFDRLNEGRGSGEGGEIRNLPPPRSCLCLLSARSESAALAECFTAACGFGIIFSGFGGGSILRELH